MSKKKERVSYLVGIRNAINQPDSTEIVPDVSNNYVYTKKKIQSVLKTIDHLLAQDGVFPMNADERVN